MDFNDTAEEAAFRADVRRFLEVNAKRKIATETAHRGRYIPDANLAESLARAKEWQAKKADAGFAAITWPRKWGGRGGSPIEQVIYNQEEANYAVLRGAFEIGLGMCIPTMMAYATPEQLERHIRQARKSGVNSSPSPRPAPTSPDCARAPNARATTGSSTVRRSGPQGRTSRISALSSPAPIQMFPSTRALRSSFCR
jgi:alkylation response protein AidB-like acyl-CoA dehydrogenase